MIKFSDQLSQDNWYLTLATVATRVTTGRRSEKKRLIIFKIRESSP